MDFQPFLGPLGYLVGCLTIITVLWKMVMSSIETMRKDLSTCNDMHNKANDQIQTLLADSNMMKGKLSVLEAQGTNRLVSMDEMVKAFSEALKITKGKK